MKKNLKRREPTDCYVVLCTAGGEKEGERISRIMIREGLAACVNIIPKVKSIYTWKGKVYKEEEALMVIKTDRRRIKEIMQKIKALHSYEVPEILALKVEEGEKSYTEWLRNAVRSKAKKDIDNKRFKR